MQVFKGYVRRVTHNDSTIKIQLEDLTQLKLHKPVPVERTSSSWSIANKYKEAAIQQAEWLGFDPNANMNLTYEP